MSTNREGVEEQSSFPNLRGFFNLLEKLMNSVTISELSGDLQAYHNSLWSLYGWISPFFDKADSGLVEKHFKTCQGFINGYVKCVECRNSVQASVYYNKAKGEADWVKRKCARVMKEQNLLTWVKEKGLNIFG